MLALAAVQGRVWDARAGGMPTGFVLQSTASASTLCAANLGTRMLHLATVAASPTSASRHACRGVFSATFPPLEQPASLNQAPTCVATSASVPRSQRAAFMPETAIAAQALFPELYDRLRLKLEEYGVQRPPPAVAAASAAPVGAEPGRILLPPVMSAEVRT